MGKEYGLHFGPTLLSASSGLSPTFTAFVRMDTGATVAPPGITQIMPGLGMYKFNYQPSYPIYFEIDGATTGLGIYRYIQGVLDPNDRVDEFTMGLSNLIAQYGQSLVALGNTMVALGISNYAWGNSNFALGTTAVALGVSNYAWGATNFALGTLNLALGNSNYTLGGSNYALATLNYALGGSNYTLGGSIYSQALLLQQQGSSTYAQAVLNQQQGSSIYAQAVLNQQQGSSIYAQGLTTYAYMSGASGFAPGIADLAARIGTTAASFGDTAVDPGTVFGYLKRTREYLEGNSNYTKATGILLEYSRGSSVLIASKTLTETVTNVTKT
jgi:hypothetical protein